MKPPLKPFTVEVKRSRSNPPAAKPAGGEPPVFADIRPVSVPPSHSHSQARQLAEQLFASLTVEPAVEPAARLSAESVFRPLPRRIEVTEQPADEPVPSVPAPPAATSEEAVSPKPPRKPRKPRAVKDKKPPAPVGTIAAAKVAEAPEAAIARPVRSIVAAAVPGTPPLPVRLEQTAPATAAADPEERRNWGPGERWKRRLRHLR